MSEQKFPIVLTLDAGGTNFVFGAMQDYKEVGKTITLSAKGESIEAVLKTIINGFEQVIQTLDGKPDAISFCFPGPADYENGIIGDLQNLPHFRGGIALKAMLENQFKIPVYINNDGDLFAYGEAIAGFLPELNQKLKDKGSIRKYKNLFGITFGTGFGGGITTNGQLYFGDNSAGGEINRLRNKLYPGTSAEDSVAIRAIERVYCREAGIDLTEAPTPKDIFEIAKGEKSGNKEAAVKAFEELGEVAGNALADSMSLLDGIVVIGGGLSGAHSVFMQKLVDEMNAGLKTLNNEPLSRMEVVAYNLESEEGFAEFSKDTSKKIKVPFSDQEVDYDPIQKIGVGVSKLGTSKAVAFGAYAFALQKLGK